MYFLWSCLAFCFWKDLILSHLHENVTPTFLLFLFHITSFPVLFSLLKKNSSNKLIFVLHQMSYCTFIKFNLSTLLCLVFMKFINNLYWIWRFSVCFNLSIIWHSGSHPLLGNVLSTWLSVARIPWFSFWFIGPLFLVSVADSVFS